MKLNGLFAATALAAALAAGHAMAGPTNQDEPSGPVILDLNGTPIPHAYQQYTATFTATDPSTNLSFAFREDPAFLILDDVSLVDQTTSSSNLLTNGDFEAGPVGASAPTGWTYLNTFGASFGGFVDNGAHSTPHGGANDYYDGAVQAYDGITQNVATTAGHTYQVSFWLYDDGNLTTFSRLSTNGDVTDTGGNGANLVVYAGGIPVRSGTPEPAAWALMILGFGGVGAALRRRANPLAAA